MILPYNDAEKIAEATEFLRNGGDEQKVAAFLKCRVEDLPQLLGLPSVKPAGALPDFLAMLVPCEKELMRDRVSLSSFKSFTRRHAHGESNDY